MNTRANAAVEYDEEMSAIISPRQERKKMRSANNRTDKIANGAERKVNPKFIAEDETVPANGQQFTPRGENQKKLLRFLQEGRKLVWAIGVAGTGKSMIAAYHAAQLYKRGEIDKIYLIRPNVAVGNSVGMLKGSLEEKLLPHFLQTISHLEKFLGVKHTKYCMDKGIIKMHAVEFTRGMSFDRAFVISEESQNFDESEFEMLMTRVGSDGYICFTGDQRQCDLKGNSGLTTTLDMIAKAIKERPEYLDEQDLAEFFNNIGVVEFGFDDVQRSGMVRALTKLYYHKGR